MTSSALTNLGAGASAGTTSPGATAAKLLADGRQFLGVPYKWGGTTPSGFDCSGLVQFLFRRQGIDLPRVAADQARMGREVSPADAQPGDLVAFGSPVDHIGIYAGNGQMLVAPHTGAFVRMERVDLATCSHIRRVLPDSPPVMGTQLGAGDVRPAALRVDSSWSARLPGAGQQYASQITAAAAAAGIDPRLLAAVAWQESGFQANARSGAGALGLMQLMPGTAAGLGVNPLDPEQALLGGARYLAAQLAHFGGRIDLAVAAYNAGPGAVQKAGGVSNYPETRNYVSRVLTHLVTLSGSTT
jgi:hypothetical protein